MQTPRFKQLVLAVFALAAPSSLLAQADIPPQQGFDFAGWVTGAITNLVTNNAAVVVADALILAKLIAIYLLMVRGAVYMLRAQGMHWPTTPLDDLGIFIGKFLAVLGMLHYYATPLPGVGFSFHEIFTTAAHDLAGLINLASLDQFTAQVQAISANLQKPGVADILGLVVYLSTLLQMAIVQAALFFVTSFGFVALGIGSLLGPIFISLYMWPTQSGKFYRWLDFMIVYSFYQVVAVAFVYIWTNVIVVFFNHALHGDYGLAHLLVLAVPFLTLNITFIISMFKVPSITAELFGGAGSAGASIATSLTSAAGRAARFLTA